MVRSRDGKTYRECLDCGVHYNPETYQMGFNELLEHLGIE